MKALDLPTHVAPGWAAARFDADTSRRVVTKGVADLIDGDAVTLQTRFRWFSLTKLATAVVTLRLVEAGRLDLDAPVSEALEWFRPEPATPAITARHLLSHASGLADPWAIGWVHPLAAARRTPTELTLQTLRRYRRLNSEPGVVGRYSNLGYLVLGELVSHLAGMPFDRVVGEKLLAPLGLERTSFDPRGAAAGHERLFALRSAALLALRPSSRHLVRYLRHGWLGLHPFAIEGQAYGGLVGSLADLARFGRALLRDGELDGTRLLSADSLALMRQRHARGPRLVHGLGFKLDGELLYHAGEAGGFRAFVQIDRRRGSGVAVLANSGTAAVEAVAAAITATGD